MLALSPNVLLILEPDKANPSKLLLESVTYVKDIREVVTNTANHEITFKGQSDSAVYLVCEQIEQVLEFINPIQMVERRVALYESGQHSGEEQIIRDYGFLVEYYSLRDEAKSNDSLLKMKNIIASNYNKSPAPAAQAPAVPVPSEQHPQLKEKQ